MLGNLDSPTESSPPSSSSSCVAAANSAVVSGAIAISKPSPSTPRSASIDLGIPLSNPSLALASLTGGGDSLTLQQHSAAAGVAVNGGCGDLSSSSGSSTGSSATSGVGGGQTTSLPFTLNGLTTTLATLSASLSTLSENGGGSGGVDSSDLLASLRRNGSSSPDHQLADLSDKLHPAFSVSDSKSLGLHRDFLSYTNH